jgi:hypothetical protein
MWKKMILATTCGAALAGEPVALFNGKDLEGWTFDVVTRKTQGTEIWSVKDGVLVCSGKPPAVMRTLRDFADYELVVEWRWPAGGKPGNAGVLVHASEPRHTYVWPKSIEVQLQSGDAGDLWTIGESVGQSPGKADGRRIVNLTDGSEKAPGEWNTLTIRCEGKSLTVHVNGTKVNEAAGLSTGAGAICLQSEGAEIHFRKLLLTPLPAAK